MRLIFVEELKTYFNKNNKKTKSDYVLNVNKIIKEKISADAIHFNSMQAFVLNYEIKKLLDKAINVCNNKYTTIVYVNSGLNVSNIKNTTSFMTNTYKSIDFEFRVAYGETQYVDYDVYEITNGMVTPMYIK
jgi:hypothetical protein